MDHIYASLKTTIPPLQIPYLARIDYDGGEFQAYPERRGLKSGDIRWGRWLTEEDAAPFLQEWLFFGLMEAFFGINVRQADFVCKSDLGRPVISTEALPRYVHEWLDRCSEVPKELRKDQREQQRAYLLHAQMYSVSPTGNRNKALVSLSISILIQALNDANIYLSNTMDDSAVRDGALYIKISDFFRREEPLLEERLLNQGWCRKEVARLRSKDLPCTTLYYLSCLERNFRGVSHNSCTETHCLLDEVAEDEYETQHLTDDCTCDHAGVPVKQLRSIVRDGGIPIFACSVGHSGELDAIEVLNWTPEIQYVAISHVWSDGLGNPSGNTLPECRIQELCRLIKSLQAQMKPSHASSTGAENELDVLQEEVERLDITEPGAPVQYHFWIDSMCIPTGEAHQDLRKKAILRMRDIYANASAVLVLDDELARFSGLSTVQEKLARIVCSVWMRRCWTLQELALSRSCYVRFSDTLFDLSNNIKTDKGYWPTALFTEYDFDSNYHYLSKQFADVLYLSSSFDPDQSADEIEADKFSRIWNCMTWRSTTREEDRYIILAILLRIDPGKLLSLPSSQERMRAILAEQRVIPMSMLNLKCRRQDKQRFSWAPTEFSSTALDLKRTEWPGIGLLDAKGLNISCSGLILPQLTDYAEFYAFKDPRDNRWRLIQHQFLDNDHAKDDLIRNSAKHHACFLFDNGPYGGVRLALQQIDDDTVLVVRHFCQIGILEMASEHLPADIDSLNPLETPGVGFGFGETFIPIVIGQWTESNQRWCIC